MKRQNSNVTSFIAVAIVILLFANFKIFSNIITSDIPDADYSVYEQINAQNKADKQEQSQKEKIEKEYSDLPVTFEDTKQGFLVLVNKQHMYDFDATPSQIVQEFPESVFDSKTSNYFVKDRNVSLCPTAITALNSLIDDFASQTGHKDLIIVDAYRSEQMQQTVLDAKIAQLGEEQGRLIAQTPGASEHHTGLALDLSLYIDSKRQEYDGTGDYEWITNNAYKYGFVIRYPEDKTNITGIDYEPWHLRYVGQAHSYYMHQNNLCLEEYISLLSQKTLLDGGLEIKTENQGQYLVYSQPVSIDSTANLKVPKFLPYTLSGDNAGHIIVTVQTVQISSEDINQQ